MKGGKGMDFSWMIWYQSPLTSLGFRLGRSAGSEELMQVFCDRKSPTCEYERHLTSSKGLMIHAWQLSIKWVYRGMSLYPSQNTNFALPQMPCRRKRRRMLGKFLRRRRHWIRAGCWESCRKMSWPFGCYRSPFFQSTGTIQPDKMQEKILHFSTVFNFGRLPNNCRPFNAYDSPST